MKTVLAVMLVAALTVGCATTDDEKQDVGAAADSAVWLEGGAGCTNADQNAMMKAIDVSCAAPATATRMRATRPRRPPRPSSSTS